MKTIILLCCLIQVIRCHCPHMMGIKMNAPSGPSPPGKLPDGDEGWDWDEDTMAPGSVPREHFIQTTIIHRSNTESEKKYARELIETLKDVKERLKKEARVTVDNENIDCSKGDESYRCAEYPKRGSYHFLIVEDSSHGAAVYSLEKKYNENNAGKIEMALLDALSRHSPHPLLAFASRAAEKEVGFVRAIDARELAAFARPPTKETMATWSPFEMKLIENSLLELRHGEGLDTVANTLTSFSSQEQFDQVLEKSPHLFVLFWSNVHAISLHTYNLWARVSNEIKNENVVLAHVECHKHAEFCEGLKPKDFQTVVAYRDGENVASTHLIGDVEYYKNWVNLVLNGPLIRLQTQEEYNLAKKGDINSLHFPVITVGIFPDTECTEFNHLSIVAQKLFGRYAMAYFVKEGSTATLSTYIPSEKRKRRPYEGAFDPSSLLSFVTISSLPTTLDVSSGFTTDVLFRQSRSLICLLAPPTFDLQNFEKLAGREDARKSYMFITMDRERNSAVDDVLDRLFVEDRALPRVILFQKYKVHVLEILESNTVDELWTWLQHTDDIEPDVDLSPKDVHPLRMLQVAQVNQVFGPQNTVILPDHTLFEHTHPTPSLPAAEFNTAGGCPFMAGGGGLPDPHDEL